jgi:hypothetical protein
MDIIDRLVDRLNQIGGLTFYRDARMESAPDANYGVVRLTGESAGSWADGHLVDQAFGLTVTVYAKDENVGWLAEVQGALDAFDLFYRLPARNYIEDIDAVEWEWNCTLYGPLDSEDDNGQDNI